MLWRSHLHRKKLGTVAWACHASYMGGWVPDDHGSRQAMREKKKLVRYHLNGKRLDLAHSCHPTHGGKRKLGRFWSWEKVRPYLQNTQRKRARGITQMLENLPSSCKALSSNYQILPRREREKEMTEMKRDECLKTQPWMSIKNCQFRKPQSPKGYFSNLGCWLPLSEQICLLLNFCVTFPTWKFSSGTSKWQTQDYVGTFWQLWIKNSTYLPSQDRKLEGQMFSTFKVAF
jgi:hypothetical protein